MRVFTGVLRLLPAEIGPAHAVSQVTVGGLTVIAVPSREEAHKWTAKWADACRCDQEIWELGLDPKIDAMLREAADRRPRPDDN